MHPEEWNAEVKRFLTEDGRRNPFDYGHVQYIREVRESKQLNHLGQSAVIIAASGMAEAGRILHHLKNNIEDPDNTILFVSFQAENTLGRRIKDGLSPVRIFGEEYKVRARVESIDGYSAHADQAGLLQWANAFDRQRLQQLFLVHGEPEPSSTLAEKLRADGMANVNLPTRGQQFSF
jgi:metallo-beta-lactamase family protein